MDSTLGNRTARPAGELKIHLLWRHGLRDSASLAAVKAAGRAVIVRLVNQKIDREKLQAAGLRLVTLPMAFAGLREDDQVLREAVRRRLQEQGTARA